MTLALTVICLSLSVVSIGCFCSTISPLLQGKLIFAQADSLDLRFRDRRHPWTKNTCACREATGQSSKTSPRRYFRLFLCGANLTRTPIGRKKRRKCQAELSRSEFWPLLAAKIEFYYGAIQTVNLLALRLLSGSNPLLPTSVDVTGLSIGSYLIENLGGNNG